MISTLPPASPWEWILVWQSASAVEGGDDQVLMVCACPPETRVRWRAHIGAPGLLTFSLRPSPACQVAYSLDGLQWTDSLKMSALRSAGCLWSPVLHRTATMVHTQPQPLAPGDCGLLILAPAPPPLLVGGCT